VVGPATRSLAPERARRLRGHIRAAATSLLLAAIASGLLASGSAAARSPVPKMIWGPVTLSNGQSAFPIYRRLGVNVFQIDLNWADSTSTRPTDPTNPADPAYHWPALDDQAVAQASRYGMQVCFLVQGAPPWSNGGRSTSWAPNDPQDYGNFLIAASRHYPSVRQWMIWGEPNRDGNFLPMPANSRVGPRRYALVLDAAYGALKSVSRSNIVIGGDTWTFGLVPPAYFVSWMRLPNGKPPRLDYYGHNPFSVRYPRPGQKPYYPGLRDIDDIGTLEQQLASTYHRQVKLWLSEFTVSADRNNRAFSFHVSAAAQGRWITAAFKLVNSVNFVAGLGWYDLADEPPSVPGRLTNGLMTWKYQPKPAFYAYQRAR
jgi:hypothetical protein